MDYARIQFNIIFIIEKLRMNRRPDVQSQINKQTSQWRQTTGGDEQQQDEQFLADFTQQQIQIIDSIAQQLSISTRKSAEALQKFQFDEAQTISYLMDEKERQEAEKKKKKSKKQKNNQQQQKLQVPVMSFKKSETNSIPRKISTQQAPINIRKGSLVAQQYQKDHYNTDYPDLEMKSPVQPSKTLNIVVVGHVDSGKSTLVGKLLYLIKQVSNKQMHKIEKQSKEMGKESFKYAWFGDETEEQRKRGVTIDVGVKKIKLNDRSIVFLDSPGHRDFIPNMITGAAQADYAILVIDVTHFDSTFISGGQTKEHAYIVKSLGVQTIIVVVNKMDVINWNPQAFETIKKKLSYYLLSIGFLEANIIYVPISAFYGNNLEPNSFKAFSSNGIKYQNTLISVLEGLPLPIRPVNKPLRINITNIYESPIGKIKGHCLSGKIEGGIVRKDQKYVILPLDIQCIVKEILIGTDKVKEAVVGDNVQIQIKLIDSTYFETIKYGNVLSSLNYSIPVTNKFVVEAMALELEMPILKGTSVMIYIGSNKSAARITKINCKYDPKTGEVIKRNCKSIHSNDCVEIQIESEQKICIQKFSNYKIFGRVIIREKKSTLCVGTVTLIK